MFMSFHNVKSILANVVGYGLAVGVATAIATVGSRAVDSIFD